MINNQELYNKCWDKWGAQLQIDILIEEMAELTHALLKARRDGMIYTHNVSAEFADVEICMDQLRTQMLQQQVSGGNIYTREVCPMRQEKLNRLERRVNDD